MNSDNKDDKSDHRIVFTGKREYRERPSGGTVIKAAILTILVEIIGLIISFGTARSNDSSQIIINVIIMSATIGLPVVVAIWFCLTKRVWSALGIIIGLAVPFLLGFLCNIALK